MVAHLALHHHRKKAPKVFIGRDLLLIQLSSLSLIHYPSIQPLHLSVYASV